MKTEKIKSYKYETFSQYELERCIIDFRRTFSYLGNITIIVPIEDGNTMEYLREYYTKNYPTAEPYIHFCLGLNEAGVMTIKENNNKLIIPS